MGFIFPHTNNSADSMARTDEKHKADDMKPSATASSKTNNRTEKNPKTIKNGEVPAS